MPDFPTRLNDRAFPYYPDTPTPTARPLQFKATLNGHSYRGDKIIEDDIYIHGPLHSDCFGEWCQFRLQFERAPLTLGVTLPAIILPNARICGGIILSLQHPSPEQKQGLQMLMAHFTAPEPDVSGLLAGAHALAPPTKSSVWRRAFSGALRQRFFQ